MTDEQYARLPEPLRDVVDTDRKLAALTAAPVLDFKIAAHVRSLRELQASRRAAAASLWGQARNDGARG